MRFPCRRGARGTRRVAHVALPIARSLTCPLTAARAFLRPRSAWPRLRGEGTPAASPYGAGREDSVGWGRSPAECGQSTATARPGEQAVLLPQQQTEVGTFPRMLLHVLTALL